MSVELLRMELIEALDKLSEEQVRTLLQVARLFQPSPQPPPAYDESKDIFLEGLFEGPTDLSSRVEGIIEKEARKRGAWTQKDGS